MCCSDTKPFLPVDDLLDRCGTARCARLRDRHSRGGLEDGPTLIRAEEPGTTACRGRRPNKIRGNDGSGGCTVAGNGSARSCRSRGQRDRVAALERGIGAEIRTDEPVTTGDRRGRREVHQRRRVETAPATCRIWGYSLYSSPYYRLWWRFFFRPRIPLTIAAKGTGPTATACSRSRWKSFPRWREVRRLNRKVNSSR